MNEQEYAGFWVRVGAALIDSILLFIVISPLMTAIYGMQYWTSPNYFQGFWDVVVNYLLPAIAIIIFWIYRAATPGKMMLKLTIVDAKTGGQPSKGQYIGRYLAYYVSAIPLFLGLIWVGIDKRKQGWHDMLAGTLVLRNNQTVAVNLEPADE